MTGVVTRTIEIADINPQEMANIFTAMWAEEQAAFFAEVWKIAREWPGAGWCQQSHAITEKLDNDGRETIRVLASHALERDL